MRVLIASGGVVVSTVSGLSLEEASANNPLLTVVEDTFGFDRVIGMTYADGALSGEATPDPVPPGPTAEEIQAAIIAATQARLDAFAKTRNYDGILSASTYATSTVPKFAAEGQYAVDARDQTWSALYTLMGAVLSGALPMPESFGDVEPLLPELAWPV